MPREEGDTRRGTEEATLGHSHGSQDLLHLHDTFQEEGDANSCLLLESTNDTELDP